MIFAGGTGNPFFSTDTAAVLRALEIEAEVIMKATGVDGIFTGDPKKEPDAQFIPELSFQEAIVKNYAVMDVNAFGLCRETSFRSWYSTSISPAPSRESCRANGWGRSYDEHYS
ncbi:MAG: hypothetical protein R2882_03390 [Gemmatimonadales bacterium]